MEQKSSFAQILSRHREQLGGPVSLEDVFTLHDLTLGEIELSEEERSVLLERVSADPEAAKHLLNLMRFPNSGSEGAEAAEPLDARWAAFRQRILTDSESEGVSRRSPVDSRPSSPTGPRIWPLAASFVLGVVLMYWIVPHIGLETDTKDAPNSWVNMPIVELVDNGSGPIREPRTVRLPTLSRGLVVTLYTSSRNLPESGPFEVRVSTPDNPEVQIVPGLEPGPGGVFVLGLPGETLTDGPHRLELLHDEKTLAVFFLDLKLSK